MTALLPEFHAAITVDKPAPVYDLQLDSTKVGWYRDRIESWARGEKIAPVTMDVAWTRKCSAACNFCVFPDSRILMADGSLISMVDVRPGHRLVSVDENGNPSISTVTAQFQTSPSMRGLQIETLFGKLKCTADHLVLTDNGWVAAGDLRVGDYVYRASSDRSREATAPGEIEGVLGQPRGGALERKGTAATYRIQQDQNSREVVAGGPQKVWAASHAHKQDASANGKGNSRRSRARDKEQCIGEISPRSAFGRGEAIAQAAIDWEYAGRRAQHEFGKASGTQRAHEALKSDEEREDRCESTKNHKATSWYRLFVSLVQTALAGRQDKGQASFRKSQATKQSAHEALKSDEKSGCGQARTSSVYAGSQGGGFSAYEANLGRRQNYAIDVHGAGQRQGCEQDRAKIVPDLTLLSWPLHGERDVLALENGERCSAQSGLRFWGQEDGIVGSRNVLAPRPSAGSVGDERLYGGGVASLCVMDETNIELDVGANQGGHQIVVGRSPILSIADAGSSAVYDLECRPHHNFVADGIVIHNCYAMLQSSDGQVITREHAFNYLADAAEVGVKGVSLISDGESTEVPYFAESVVYGASLGLQLGTSSNGVKLTPAVLDAILPGLSYLRFNFSGGDKHRWAQIMGLKSALFDKVCSHIRYAMEAKRRNGYNCNINCQMVVMPQDADQILPLTKLCKEVLRPDYLIFKHTADSRDGDLGIDYRQYSKLFPLFEEAETYSDDEFRVSVKWSRLADEGKRDYQRCYGVPFIIQMSGNGLLAPCGQLFNERYKKYHIGSICEERFRDIVWSDRYWEVVRHLASDDFNAQRNCGPNCLQTNTNSWLNKFVQGQVAFPTSPAPPQMGFL